MTTRRIYYDDSYTKEFSARVVSCEAMVHANAPAWGVMLDQSGFYPTSGGQPHDLGRLGSTKLLEVLDEDDEILHIVDQPVSDGEVQCCIEWPRRFDHMQQHTGQHLLSAMFLERFGRHTVSFHMGAELSTIDLRGPEPSGEILEGAERAANEIIFQDRPVTVRYGTAEDLAALGVRKEVDRPGILRAIEIEGADLQPCGGTHVRSTGQIGTLLVRRGTKIRQDWRVEFVCGARAARVARHDFLRLRAAAEKLSCAPEDIVASAERAVSERDLQFKRTRGLLQRLAEIEAERILREAQPGPEGLHVVSRVFEGIEPEYLGHFAAEIAKNERHISLLAHRNGGQIIFAQHPAAGKDMAALLKDVLAKLGGKGGGTHDFARGRLEDETNAERALALASEFLAAKVSNAGVQTV